MSGRTGRGSSLARAGRRAGGGWSAFQPRGRPPPASAMARSLRLYRPRLSAPVQVVALRHRGTPPPAVACVLLPPAAMRAAPARPLRHLGGLQPPVCRPRGHLRVAPSPPHAGRDRLLWRPYPRLGRLRPPARRSPPPPARGPRSPPVPLVASARCGCLRVALSYHAGRARLSPPRRLGGLRHPYPAALTRCGHLRFVPPPLAGRDRLLPPLLVSLAGASPPYGRLVLKGAPLRPPCVAGQLDVSRETCARG